MKAIVAFDDNYGIGFKNTLPWPHNKEDMVWFREMTIGKAVIMGRNTFESLPQPLRGRLNIVVTNSQSSFETVYNSTTNTVVVYTKIDGIEDCMNIWGYTDAVIIGGAKIFKTMEAKITELYATKIKGIYNCDTFFDLNFSFTERKFVKKLNETSTVYRYSYPKNEGL